MEDRSTLTLLSNAYLNLLRISHNSQSRHRVQGALCECRDELAYITGRTGESIQNEFEAAAHSAGQRPTDPHSPGSQRGGE